MDEALLLRLTRNQRTVALKCSPLEQNFVLKFLEYGCDDKRQADAMKAAYGENPPDVKLETFKKNAKRMLGKPRVRDFLDVMQQHSIHLSIMTKAEAELRLTQSARTTMDDVVEWHDYIAGQDEQGNDVMQTAWRLKQSEDLPWHVKAAIKSVTVTSAGKCKLELHDSTTAIKALADIKGWNAPTKNQNYNNSLVHSIESGETPISKDELEKSLKMLMDHLN